MEHKRIGFIEKVRALICNSINIVCIICFLFTFYVVMFDDFKQFKILFNGIYNNRYLASDMISNLFIAMMAILLGIAVGCCIKFKKNRIKTSATDVTEQKFKYWIIMAMIILLAAQIFVAIHIYHYGWSDVSIVRGAAQLYVNGVKGDFFYQHYLPQAPNQIYYYAIVVLVYSLSNLLGIENGYLSLIAINIMLANLACVFAAKTIYRLSYKVKLSKITFILCALLVGLSPWIVFPYTDMLSILIPVLSYYIYLCLRDKTMPELLRWIAICILPLLSYQLKATNVVVLIAVILTEIFVRKAFSVRQMVAIIVAIAVIFPASKVLTAAIQNSVEYQADSNIERDIKWYFLLGSNYENMGVYNFDDENLYDIQLLTKEEKDAVIPGVIVNRYKEMGLSGILRHWANKSHLFYDDGTFSWGFNGGILEYPDDTSFITVFMRNLMWPDGEYSLSQISEENDSYGIYYRYFVIYQQIVWMVIYVYMGIFILFGNKKDCSCVILKLIWAGTFLFSMLFETNARLLLSYLPLFCCMAVLGYQWMIERVRVKKWERAENSGKQQKIWYNAERVRDE